MEVTFSINVIGLITTLISVGGAIMGLAKFIQAKEAIVFDKIEKKADREAIDKVDAKLDHLTDRIDHIYDKLINGKSHKSG